MRANGAIEKAATGFSVGDSVIVLKKYDTSKLYVVAHTDGIRACVDVSVMGDYFIFYLDGTILKVAHCSYNGELEVIKTINGILNYGSNVATRPITFHVKRFTHNVANGSTTTARDLYFVATSLFINPDPVTGWVNFSAANIDFSLVTNMENSQIPMTDQVLIDLNAVNYAVNHDHAYISDPAGNDNWAILTGDQAGDCEDMALTKAQALLTLGYPASALHIECGFVAGVTRGHAWLVVQTETVDYALDLVADAVRVNSSCRYPGTGEEYTQRTRQIGPRWGAISPLAWLPDSSRLITQPLQSVHPASGMYCINYIYDPLVNIFYLIPDFGGVPNVTTAWLPFSMFNEITVERMWFGDNPPSNRDEWPFALGSYHIHRYSSSVNFSADNNSIYISQCDGTTNVIKEYSFGNNAITVVSSNSVATLGYVGRDGIIVPIVDSVDYEGMTWQELQSVDVVSENGYYSFEYKYLVGSYDNEGPPSESAASDTVPVTGFSVGSEESDTRYLPVIFNKASGQPFYWNGTGPYDYHYHYGPYHHPDMYYPNPPIFDTQIFGSPYGVISNAASGGELVGIGAWPYYTGGAESFDSTNTGNGYYAHALNQIDTDGTLVQSFLLRRLTSTKPDICKFYKDGVDCTDKVIAAAGVEMGNIAGFVYLPSTDRLNRTT